MINTFTKQNPPKPEILTTTQCFNMFGKCPTCWTDYVVGGGEGGGDGDGGI